MIRASLSVLVLMTTGITVAAHQQAAAPVPAAFDGYCIARLPDLNHLFQKSTTGALIEYAKIEETFAPIALETMGRWIGERVLTARR